MLPSVTQMQPLAPLLLQPLFMGPPSVGPHMRIYLGKGDTEPATQEGQWRTKPQRKWPLSATPMGSLLPVPSMYSGWNAPQPPGSGV